MIDVNDIAVGDLIYVGDKFAGVVMLQNPFNGYTSISMDEDFLLVSSPIIAFVIGIDKEFVTVLTQDAAKPVLGYVMLADGTKV